jgi:hypothetical protein
MLMGALGMATVGTDMWRHYHSAIFSSMEVGGKQGRFLKMIVRTESTHTVVNSDIA